MDLRGSPREGRRPRREGAPSRCARPRACSLAAERERLSALHEIERSARAEGFRFVAGVDEVGRGALAGPVFAAAVVLDPDRPVPGLDDSKALSPEVRLDLAPRIRERAFGVGVGSASPAEVDGLGIAPATFLAMRRALAELSAGSGRIDISDSSASSGFSGFPDLVLVDGFLIPGFAGRQRSFVKGDSRVAAIAAASIIAKTIRDTLMETLHAEFPHYGFASHRGYGCAAHLDALGRFGPSPHHRLTFDRVLPAPSRGSVAAA